MFDNIISVYRTSMDVSFFVCGPADGNELVLLSVLTTIFDSISVVLKGNVEKRTLLDNMEILLLIIDEAIDGGLLLEAASDVIVQRVSMRSDSDLPFSEQTVQTLQAAKEQFTRSLLKGT